MGKSDLVCKRGFHFIFIGFLLFFQVLLTHAQTVKAGKADLSLYDFNKKSPSRLSGEWEFYWNKLLAPDDSSVFQNPELIHVPGSWNRQKSYPALGFATYRLQLKLPEKQH